MKKTLILLFFICLNKLTLSQNVTTAYIEQYKHVAVKKMAQYGVPASIILGVAIHESGSGTSKIARILNNHFGIKGLNYHTEYRSKYKSYDSVTASYTDFSILLKTHKKFSHLFDKYSIYDYNGLVWGMQQNCYAASKTWGQKVLAIIKKYRLYEYDDRPDDYQEPIQELDWGKESTISRKKITYYQVKKGDTFSSIAKKYKITVPKLLHKNQLKTTHLRIGQKLKI